MALLTAVDQQVMDQHGGWSCSDLHCCSTGDSHELSYKYRPFFSIDPSASCSSESGPHPAFSHHSSSRLKPCIRERTYFLQIQPLYPCCYRDSPSSVVQYIVDSRALDYKARDCRFEIHTTIELIFTSLNSKLKVEGLYNSCLWYAGVLKSRPVTILIIGFNKK